MQWRRAPARRETGTTVAIPTALKVGNTYLIFSEVTYKYIPTIGYVMAKTGST